MRSSGKPDHTSGTGIAPRLDLQSGSIDRNFGFAANAGGSIFGAVRDATSASLFLYGNFSSINSVPLTHLARIDEGTTALDETFVVNINGSLRHILSDAQGGLWLSGGFNQVNGNACVTPARLLIAAGGQLDPAFS